MAEPRIRARPDPSSVSAPPAPWHMVSQGLAEVPLKCPHLALPSELAAWFSMHYSCSREPASSSYTDQNPGHLPFSLPSTLSQDLEGPRFPSKATMWVLNVLPWLRRRSSTSCTDRCAGWFRAGGFPSLGVSVFLCEVAVTQALILVG